MLNMVLFGSNMSLINCLRLLFFELIYSVISVCIDIAFFMQLFKMKINKTKFLTMLLVSGMSNFILFVIIPPPYNRILDYIITFLAIKFILKQPTEKAALAETINAIILITLETIFAKILCYLFSDVSNYLDCIHNPQFRMTMKINIIVSRLIILFVVYKLQLKIILSDQLHPKNKRSIYVVALLGILINIHTEIQLFHIEYNYLFIGFLINVSLYIYICIQNVIRINMLEAQKLKIHTLEAYNKTLSLMYDNIRGFKHDFSNFIIALDGYAKTNNITGIKQMSKSILKDCNNVNKMEILDPKIIPNSAIYSIITSKYYLAKKQNLNMNIEIFAKIEENAKNNYEICRILGILLDNAIEAAKDTKDKIINIKFIKDKKIERKLVIIENSYLNKNIDLDKIYDKGYTSKTDGKEHGLGLWNIRNILMTNEDLNLFTTTDDCFFKQQLEIY